MRFHLQNKDGSVNWGRAVRVFFILLLILVFGGYGIFALHNAYEHRKWDAREPSTRTYGEFAEAFNAFMEPQGIAMDRRASWEDPSPFEGRAGFSMLTFPDGSQAPCAVKLWSYSVKKDYIYRLAFLLSKEQAQYLEPVVRGGFSVFSPGLDEQDAKDLADILAAGESAFTQPASEKSWHLLSGVEFALRSEDSNGVFLLWSIPELPLWRGY